MLRLTIPAQELWDDKKECFIQTKEQTLQLEHSLVSLSKWEAKYHKPFLTKDDKTYEETLYYIQCMTITQNVNPEVYNGLTSENIKQIHDYIEDPMTATTINSRNTGNSRRIMTSELIYFYMLSFGIPVEFQKWHLNRLITLIRVCEIENAPNKKMSRSEIMSRNSALNKARKAKLHTKG